MMRSLDASFSQVYGSIPVAGEFLQATALALDPTTVALPGMVLQDKRLLGLRVKGQYSVSPWTCSDRRLVMAMD